MGSPIFFFTLYRHKQQSHYTVQYSPWHALQCRVYNQRTIRQIKYTILGFQEMFVLFNPVQQNWLFSTLYKRRRRKVCDAVCAQPAQNAAAFRPNGRCPRRCLRLRPTRGLRADHVQSACRQRATSMCGLRVGHTCKQQNCIKKKYINKKFNVL